MKFNEPGNIYGIQFRISDYLTFFIGLVVLYLIGTFSELIFNGFEGISVVSLIWLLATLNFGLSWSTWSSIIRQIIKNLRINWRFLFILIGETVLIYFYVTSAGPLGAKVFLFVLWMIGTIPLFALHQINFLQKATSEEFELCCKTYASSRLSNYLLAYGMVIQLGKISSGFVLVLLLLSGGFIFVLMGPLIRYIIDDQNQLKKSKSLLQQLPIWKPITINELKKRTKLSTDDFLLAFSNLFRSDWIKFVDFTNEELKVLYEEWRKSDANSEAVFERIKLKKICLNPLIPIDLDMKKQMQYYTKTRSGELRI